MDLNKRNNGILLHITSLPSNYGIGDLGSNAYKFVDFLSKSSVGYWQILPIGPTGYGNSPYSLRSTFAGNENLISIDSLITDGYLNTEDTEIFNSVKNGFIDFNFIDKVKRPLLFKAADNFLLLNKEEENYTNFLKTNSFFLNDYAIFMALVDYYYDARWYSIWDKGLSKRDKIALKEVEKKLYKEINRYKVLQYLFFKQWFNLKTYANKNKVKIIGDLPIFVSGDSVDTWSNIELFETDYNNNFNKVSGCPPDDFTADGQLWGNPIYDWSAHKKDNYQWWVKRIEHKLNLFDVIRIDHFRGLESYWEIPSNHKSAKYGKWVKGPGQELFDAIKNKLGKLPIIAEDLGYMTEEVELLRNNNNFPGMKIGIFGYSWDKDDNFEYENNDFYKNYEENFIAYPGTHDNQTILGWYKRLEKNHKKDLLELFNFSQENIVWKMIETLYKSKAKIVITQLQDLLELDDKARMNIPSTCGLYNWSWQLQSLKQLDDIIDKLKSLNNKYNRI